MASIDGLVTGLNTADIVRQLMQLERQPQTRLRTQQSLAQRTIDAYRGVNSLLLSLKSAAESLTTGAAWSLAKATSSDPTRVTAQSTAGARPGSLTFTVDQLAVAGMSTSAGTVTGTSAAVATAGSTIRLTKGTTATTINVGDGTLAGVVSAVNAAGAGVTAAAVQVSSGEYKLQLTSATTGAATSISLDDGAGGNPFASSTLGAVGQVVLGQDAKLKVGGAAGYTVTRASNTISDLLDGVTLTLARADAATSVTVEVTGDAAGTADAVAKMVDSVNAALADIKKNTSYDAATKKAALLVGDGLLRDLQQRLVGKTTAGNVDLSGAGVTVTRAGTLTFDRTTFLDAYAKDPAGTKARLGGSTASPGLAERLRELADVATRSATAVGGAGLITAAIKSQEDEIRGLTTHITGWDARLAMREAKLRRQFAAMETALGKMQQQGQWLAGQIASLPRIGG